MRLSEFTTEAYDRSVFRMAKLQKDSRIVRILRHADRVSFSNDTGWLLIDTTPGKAQPETMKWIPDTTAFDWVREYNSADDVTENFADSRVKGNSHTGNNSNKKPKHDYIIEYSLFDLHHEFFEEINQLDITLFENKEDYMQLKKTLDNFSTSDPTVGQKYVYASVAATPVGKIMNIAHFTQPYQLISIKDGRYYFNINGTTRIFPEQGRFDKKNSYQHIFMFDTVQQFEKMSGWVNLNYSDDNQWKVSSKKLEENFADGKTLDPEVYGEMLPTATVKRIVNSVMNRVDPDAKITVKSSPEGYYIIRGEGLRLDFGITADGGDINANIVNAYSSYKGKNVVTDIFGQCFEAAEQLWGKPAKFVMSVQQDRGYGVWQAMAKRLGAEWGGSVMENFADGKVKGKSRPGRVKKAGASCNGSVTDLRARAKRASGEKAKMYHWCANMKSGKKKK